MPLRKTKGKKYSGIYELYRKSDDKVTGYYIAYRDAEHKPVKHRIDAMDKDEALITLNQTKVDIRRDAERERDSISGFDRNVTLDALASEFLDSKSANKNIKKEEQRYENHIKPSLGKRKILSIKSLDITKLQNLLKDKELGNKSINLSTDLLRSILRHASDNHTRLSEVYRMAGYARLSVDNLVERTLSPEEVRELIKGIEKPRLKLFISMAYFSCQRPASLLRLQKKDVRDEKIYFSSIKKQKSHKITVHPELKILLDEWLEALSDDDYIFYGAERGKTHPLSYERLQMEASKLFAPFNVGLDYKVDRKQWVSLYTLRHSSATAILENTNNIALAGAILNHSDLRMTQRYSKIKDEQKATAIGSL